MKILVAAASKHGATHEIAQFIAKTLAEQGHKATYSDIEKLPKLSHYDAVVLGSAVYMGKWLRTARMYVKVNHKQLSSLPVWIFSSGPIDKQTTISKDEGVVINEILRDTKAREHKVFSGKLYKHNLSIFERAVMRAVRAQEGDFRNWVEITAWAVDIANELKMEEST